MLMPSLHGRSPSVAVGVSVDQGSGYLGKFSAQQDPEVDSLPHDRSPFVSGVASSKGISQHRGKHKSAKGDLDADSLLHDRSPSVEGAACVDKFSKHLSNPCQQRKRSRPHF